MTLNVPTRIEQLNRNHDRQEFLSGNDSLDSYLKRQASQDAKRGFCVVYVLTLEDKPDRIIR